ncbi:MAG: hypothetical protein H7263_16740 [Candidatus Sericytochromatia bacterium]|nr:hypothetical protein [Candidatus Sericytochromatia bacterium]
MSGIDLGGIINGITQVTQVVGAVNGAVNVLAPALQSVNQSVNNIAGSVGYRQDGYNNGAPQGYYPPQQGIPATMQNVQSAPSNNDPSLSSGMVSVGTAIAGGGIGAMMGSKTAASIKYDHSSKISGDIGNTELSIKLPSGSKTMVSNGLKAGGISAVVGGVFSGIENIMKLSKNQITGAEATGNVVADTSVGFFTGIGGLAAGTGAAMMLGGMSTMGGMIGGGVAGLVGAVAVDFLFRKTGIRDAIASGVRSIMGNK